MSTVPWNAMVTRRRDLNSRVAIVHVAPLDPSAALSSVDLGAATMKIAPFTPGQFIQVGLPKEPDLEQIEGQRVRWIKRSYSIASAPHEDDAYELCIASVAGGHLTPQIWPLGVGSPIWCDNAPKGFFTLERIPAGRDLVLVATGTGIAPFVSMLRATRATDRWRRFVIIHGARERTDLAYDEELRDVACVDERVRYVPVLSRGPEAWSGWRGHVQIALGEQAFLAHAGFELEPRESHVLLCGNPNMIRDVRDALAPRGFVADTLKSPGNLHFERYW